MKLPNLDDLIEEQMVVYERPSNEHLFVVGPPGSGKTSLAVLRANFLKNLNEAIVLVTRNNMLAALATQLGDGELVSKTMSSFISKNYFTLFGANAPELDRYVYNWDAIRAHYASVAITPYLDQLVVDEGQNLPSGFFRWAIQFGANNLTVFADEDQTTDSQHSSLREIRDAGLPDPIRLKANHRNTAEIAAVAEHFHRSHILPPGVVQKRRRGALPKLVSVSSWDQLANMVAIRFRNRREAIGIIVYRKLEVVMLQKMLATLLTDTIRVDAYTSNMPKEAANISMLNPGITILSGESAIGLEFDVVYLQDLNRSLPCLSPRAFRRMYMLCARARDTLILINGPSALSADQIADLPGPGLLER